MEKLTGFSIIIGNGIFYIGGYKAGIWFDNNEKLKLNREEKTGYGIKIDLCFGNTVRPIGLLWKKDYWNNEKLKISDIPEDHWDSYFGEDLASKIVRRKKTIKKPKIAEKVKEKPKPEISERMQELETIKNLVKGVKSN